MPIFTDNITKINTIIDKIFMFKIIIHLQNMSTVNIRSKKKTKVRFLYVIDEVNKLQLDIYLS